MNEDQIERLIASQKELTHSIHELVNAVALLVDAGMEPEQESDDGEPNGVYLMDGTRIS